MEKYAVIVAGGSGTRMGAAVPKQFMLLKGKPLLWYTLTAFTDAYNDVHIILVLPEQYAKKGYVLAQSVPALKNIKIVSGGNTRFESVKNGLAHISHPSMVFVHDGVRCLIRPPLIHRCYAGAIETGNAIPAIGMTDSVRIETSNGNQPVDRSKLRIIQTPQTFLSEVIGDAFLTDYQESFTDEASVVEYAGGKINLVEGEPTNIKITRPLDILIAEEILGTWQ